MAEDVTVNVKHGKNTYDISLKSDDTLAKLREELHKYAENLHHIFQSRRVKYISVFPL